MASKEGSVGNIGSAAQHSRDGHSSAAPSTTCSHSTAGTRCGLQPQRYTHNLKSRGGGSSSSPSCDNDDCFSHAPKYTKQHINSHGCNNTQSPGCSTEHLQTSCIYGTAHAAHLGFKHFASIAAKIGPLMSGAHCERSESSPPHPFVEQITRLRSDTFDYLHSA